MTACVAIAPDSRMDSSSSCVNNPHACRSDDLDPAFRPAVGLLNKVDVISAYMTVAAEIAAEREERVCAANSFLDSAAQVDTHDEVPADTTRDQESDEISTFSSIPSQDLRKRDELQEEKEAHFSPRMELNAAVCQPAAPVVEAARLLEAEDKEVTVSTNVALEFKQAAIEDQTKVGDFSTKHDATAEVSDAAYPVKEVAPGVAVAEKLTEVADIATNAKVAATAAVTREGSIIDRDEGVIENPDLRMHAYSESTTTMATTTASSNNSVAAPLDPTEKVTVTVSSTTSARPAETEDAVTDKNEENLAESVAKLAKAYPFHFTGLNHVAFCCESLERSLDFYCGLLGLKTSLDRPDLPYRGAWLLLGAEGIHIMEVPNPDPVKGRPPHGGYDRHACLNVKNVDHLRMTFDRAGINYQLSMVPSIFCRDPDGNGLEFIEVNGVHVD